MFQDEARFGRIADVRRCWCPKPLRPMVRAMVTQEYTYVYAAVCPADGRMDSLTCFLQCQTGHGLETQ
jgi:hypothetical protein